MDERLNEWLEMGMIESDRRRCALKVLSLFICENVGRGENYLSNLKRIKMEVLLHSGEQETRYMIYKSPPLGESRARLVSKIGVFVRETRVYLDVLPEMEEIVKKKEPMGDFLWPQLHCSQRRYDGLLMEDLSVKGFKMGNRRKGLDFDHCALVMRSLAKFHALGAVLRFKDYLKIKDFYPAVFNGPSIRVPGVAKDILQTCAYNMETKWGEEWADLAERMNVLADNIERLMVDENKLDAMQFNTLNHGDCWINNILFRYDKNGKPEALSNMDERVRDWIERAVVESDRRRCAAKVSSISAESAVEQGENFASDLKRLTLEVVLNSGELQTRRLIYKCLPEGENRVLQAKSAGTFVKETRVYQDVLSEMEEIWRAKEPTAEFLWPELYWVQQRYEGLLMEDLSAKGFKMEDRRKLLDYDHCALVMRSLAKFHALGAILRKKGDLRKRDYFPSIYKDLRENMPGFINSLYVKCAIPMEKVWKGEWVEHAKKLRKLGERIEEIVDKEYELDESKFLTLNHGDCWTNNILFRYDKNGKPEALRFIDFQLAHYNSPAFDIHFFLQSSPNLDTRDRKMELVQEYQESLSENLKLFGYPENEIPNLDDVMNLYNDTRFCGFCCGLISVPNTLAPKEKAKTNEELDEISKQFNENNSDLNLDILSGGDELSTKVLQYVIKEAVKNGIL